MVLKSILRFVFSLLFFAVVLAFLHDLIINNTDFLFSRKQLFGTYLFLGIATLIVYGLSYWVSIKNFERTGLAYMGFSLMKMMAFVLYLMPALKGGDPASKPIIIQQLVVYLLFLAFEAASIFKLLRKADTE